MTTNNAGQCFIMTTTNAAKWRAGHSALVWLERSSLESAERTIAAFQSTEAEKLEVVTPADFGTARAKVAA